MSCDLTFRVEKVSIFTGKERADRVSIHTTVESPMPSITAGPLRLDFDVTAGNGYQYVTRVLRVNEQDVEVISIEK